MSRLYDLVLAAHNGSEKETLVLIEKFMPLNRKLARHLPYDYDDALSDVTLEFIKLLRTSKLADIQEKNDGSVVRYIHGSMLHVLTSLTKKYRQAIDHLLFISVDESSDENYVEKWDNRSHIEDTYDWEDFNFLFTYLTLREAEIIICFFWYKLTIQEIAKKYGVASSSISRSKKCALKKIKKLIED